VLSSDGVGGRRMQSASDAMDDRDRNQPDTVVPDVPSSPRTSGGATRTSSALAAEETFHVFASGNLGLVYVRDEKQRLDRRTLDLRFPGLVDGLARHPGVGFVVVTDTDGPIALGSNGSHRILDGHVHGIDPLAPFGPHAPDFVRRVALRPEAPEIYINSLVEPGTEEVAAFEGLVGCHGGLGGWQDRAFVMYPRDVPFPGQTVLGADAMHVALRSMLRHLGHRRDVADEESAVPDAGTRLSIPT
jgi:hypothetical protein